MKTTETKLPMRGWKRRYGKAEACDRKHSPVTPEKSDGGLANHADELEIRNVT
jgi:hypothetical protein